MSALSMAFARPTFQEEPFDPRALMQAAREAELRRLPLMRQLQAACLKSDELRLAYQPKRDLRTGELQGYEALVRWNHPELGLLMPDRFIGAAEQCGLIQPLTLWVLHEALRQMRAWRQAGRDVSVAINLSARCLLDAQLPEKIADRLGAWGIPASRLELEITESAMLIEPELALRVLSRLKALGVKLTLDDFGTGYSSLTHLRDLPVDALKIDRSFVRNGFSTPADAMIVRAIIDLAHQLHLSVVAEGVEDQATCDLLASWGCDAAQGYHIGRPAFAGDLAPAGDLHAETL